MSLGTCGIVPPVLLKEIARRASGPAAERSRQTLVRDVVVRAARAAAPAIATAPDAAAGAPAWVVDTAANGSALPGSRVRTAGDPASGDATVDDAATGITATLAMYADVFGRASYDAKGAQTILTVHYGQSYDNAFWNGEQ